MPERIPESEWRAWTGHVRRYEWAASLIRPGERVLDAPCGIGYGSEILSRTNCQYIGVDKPGVPSPTFREFGWFIETDLDSWEPTGHFEVAICFEGLEHVNFPDRLAGLLGQAERLILVSVPTVPTVGENPWHLHDFTVDEVPPLFPDWVPSECWEQPEERSHVWAFTKP